MKHAILIWIGFASSFATSLAAYLVIGSLGDLLAEFYPYPLPSPSYLVYRGAFLIYLFPIPLLVWAVYLSISAKRTFEGVVSFVLTCFSVNALFLSFVIYAAVIPFGPKPTFILEPQRIPSESPAEQAEALKP